MTKTNPLRGFSSNRVATGFNLWLFNQLFMTKTNPLRGFSFNRVATGFNLWQKFTD